MDLQAVIAAALVALAGSFVGRRLYRSFKGEPEGTCNKCAPQGKAKKAA